MAVNCICIIVILICVAIIAMTLISSNNANRVEDYQIIPDIKIGDYIHKEYKVITYSKSNDDIISTLYTKDNVKTVIVSDKDKVL